VEARVYTWSGSRIRRPKSLHCCCLRKKLFFSLFEACVAIQYWRCGWVMCEACALVSYTPIIEYKICILAATRQLSGRKWWPARRHHQRRLRRRCFGTRRAAHRLLSIELSRSRTWICMGFQFWYSRNYLFYDGIKRGSFLAPDPLQQSIDAHMIWHPFYSLLV
jgi:hypothetical protein